MAEEVKTTEQKLAEEVARAAQPIELKLDIGGEVFKGSTWEEVARAAAKAKEDTTIALKSEKQRAFDLEQRLQSQPAIPAKAEGEMKGFDSEAYWNLVKDGKIIEAQNYVDSIRFGLKPEEVVPTISDAVNKANKLSDQVELERFKFQNQDFPSTAEASESVLSLVQEWGVPWDAGTLTAAFKTRVQEGKIKPLEVKREEGRPVPIPGSAGIGAGPSGQTIGQYTLEQFAILPLEKQREVLVNAGMM